MTRDSVLRIKQAVDLPAFIAEYIPLRRIGREWIALCPFHKEKSPSLRVHDTWWKCFGCGAGGDIVTFLSLIDGVTPGDALKSLSDRTGIPLDGAPQTRVARAYDAQETAFTEWWWLRLCERLARRVSVYVGLLDIATTEEQCDAAGLRWRQVNALDRQGRRALCERVATQEDRAAWRTRMAWDKETTEMIVKMLEVAECVR